MSIDTLPLLDEGRDDECEQPAGEGAEPNQQRERGHRGHARDAATLERRPRSPLIGIARMIVITRTTAKRHELVEGQVDDPERRGQQDRAHRFGEPSCHTCALSLPGEGDGRCGARPSGELPVSSSVPSSRD